VPPDVAVAVRAGSSSAPPLAEGEGVRRVLFVTNMYPGATRPAFGIIVERLEQAIRGLGIEVEVECVSCGRGSPDYLLARRRVAQRVRDFAPDVVHVHFGYTTLATNRERPRVVSFYGDDLNGESTGASGRLTLKSRVGIAISRSAAKRCERSIAVSESLRSRIIDSEARSRCLVIRDSVDTSLFTPGDRDAARARLGIARDAELVLFPHSLEQRTKRVDLARAAVDCLRRQRPRAELWVVNGRRPSEMPDVYRAADALLVTSDLEGGPSCVKEALACGLPVVSVPVGDVQVLHEAAAVSFLSSRDPQELSVALARALSLPVARRSMLPAELTLEHSASAIRDVYRAARAAHVRHR
jgi:teichuronic acid biosynthesis glycosyltransferase TuaC